jgi:hypothetical protein
LNMLLSNASVSWPNGTLATTANLKSAKFI